MFWVTWDWISLTVVTKVMMGAKNMSSDRVGLQSLIREETPKAVYTNCSGHCLNLVIARSCGLPVVRNMPYKMKSKVNFFIYTPKARTSSYGRAKRRRSFDGSAEGAD